ncbi:heme NO-binding domain-containing protein [bacterium SCSIO 12741]|nr:heme NO-binding domain-containing protein [bacterium SCSIO 12741]
MYGIVNQAIQGLVTENFGEDKWEAIKAKAEIDTDFFMSNESYDDSVTYNLVGAASEVLEVPASAVLSAFGEYWILKTGMENYGSLLASGGDNFKEFLVNLPNFHSRVMLMYPELTPPEFQVTDVTDNTMHVHYFSEREGLADFVTGLLKGIGKMFQKNVDVEMVESRDAGADHEVFLVKF